MEDIKWLIGTGVSVVVSLFAYNRHVMGKISRGNKSLHSKIDDVKEKYVRRDDLDTHLKPIRDQLEQVHADHREIIRLLRKGS